MSHPVPTPVIVIAPDAFKGSLSAPEVANAIAEGILRALPNADIRRRPMADGGEGTLDALLCAGGHRVRLSVRGAGQASVSAEFGVMPDGTGVIESASVVGITDPIGMQTPVAQRSTVGLGDMLRALLDTGARRVLIGLGGSSTNDGGAGLLVGLGARLLDAHGDVVAPVPAALHRVASVDVSSLDARMKDCEIIVMSDVSNPLNGPQGATAIFGPQKGVTSDQMAPLDQAIAHFAQQAQIAFSAPEAASRAGAGAAGGLGFALHLLGAQFRSGAEWVAQCVGLPKALEGADWLITGEGRSDGQTLSGKAPMIAAQMAVKAGATASLLSGSIERSALENLSRLFSGCFSLTFGPTTLEVAIADTAGLLADSAEQMARLRY